MLFIKKHSITVVGIFVGAIAGYFYWQQVGCSSGTCPITSNPVRSTLYGALMGGLLFSMFNNEQTKTNKNKQKQTKMIDALKNLFGIGAKTDYAALVKNGAIILDVRSKGEFETGHIRGAVNIPVDQLRNNLVRLKDKSKPIITCCASGMRSASAKTLLKANGYSEVYNGGGWSSLQNRL